MCSICGIDEAGRGPLAGPLVVAGVVLREPIEGLNDSKKLSENQRESLYEKIVQTSLFHIVTIDAKKIDKQGISKSLAKALEEIMVTLQDCSYIFDGNCTFGVLGLNTLIKADEKIAEVSAASILAKVTRDRYMVAIAKEYPLYAFEKHKGYGTKTHIEAIKKYGRCPLHRATFLVKGSP